MFDALTDRTLPAAIWGEINRAKERIETMPAAQRQACSLVIAARLMTWAQDLEQMSVQFSRAA